MIVVNAKAFAEDVAVQLAIAKSIAQQAQCPPTWVTVSISIVDGRRLEHETLRRMQVDASTVDIDYSIEVPTADGSESSEAKEGAEARASALIEGLSGIEQDTAAFKSVVEAEFQLAGVDYEVAEVTGSSTEELLTKTWEEDQTEANMCTRQSLLAPMGMVVLSLVW